MKQLILGVVAAVAMGSMAGAANMVTVTKFHQSYPYAGKATVEYMVGGTPPANAVAEITLSADGASATFTQEHRDALLRGDFRPHGPAEGYTILEGATDSEAVFAVYAENAVCAVPQPRPKVIVVNATGHDFLYLDLPKAPTRAEAFNTFGALAGTPPVADGPRRIDVPRSGYLRLTF